MIASIYDAFLSCNQQITTDSRNICKNDIFFALKGPNFNGNLYANKALTLGASFAVIDEKKYFIEGKTFLVDNVLKCLQDLALLHRKKFNIPVIGITGTNGKTTSKELIGAVLKSKYRLLITEGNLNNHIGVPLTLLKLQKTHQIAVIEMGASKIGDIKELVEITLPNYGIITNIGKAHLEGFGNIENIRKTKFELYNYIIETKGNIIVNNDDKILTDHIPKDIKKYTYGTKRSDVSGLITKENPYLELKVISNTKTIAFSTNLIGSYNLNNLLAAFRFGEIFDIGIKKIANSITNYKPSNNRSQLIKTNNNKIIADCYNANPTSTKEALTSFKNIKHSKKLIVLGDMLELGSEEKAEHQLIVDYLKGLSINTLLVGKCYQKTKNDFRCFDNTTELLDFLKLEHLEGYYILLKGSRGIQLEKVIQNKII